MAKCPHCAKPVVAPVAQRSHVTEGAFGRGYDVVILSCISCQSILSATPDLGPSAREIARELAKMRS